MSFYDLNNLRSASPDKNSLNQRFDILYRDYLIDKQQSEYSYYNKDTNTVNKEWADLCVSKLKKITIIQIRIDDTERCISSMTGDSASLSEKVKEKKYEERLSDMSNYYSKFISFDSYKRILNTMD